MKHLLLCVLTVSALYSSERKVLVEMFTNSHCSVCPGAHAAINAYQSTSPYAARVRYIYYHTTFPYGDDPLSLANTVEPNARNLFYNGPTSTPNTFFDGVNQGRTYSLFGANLDARMAVESPLEILLTGKKNGMAISVSAVISQTGLQSQKDLVVHFIAVEHVSYVGRNGVAPQDFVMRKLLTPAAGEPITIDANSPVTLKYAGEIPNITEINNAGVVVFVQSAATKEVLQSEFISTAALTGVGQFENSPPFDFVLQQNYPNPFNPSTTISFSIPGTMVVSLKIYDVLGNETASVINALLGPGMHSYRFSADAFSMSSGVYFYKLESGGRTIVRRMMLLK